jgi:hypothetical protein
MFYCCSAVLLLPLHLSLEDWPTFSVIVTSIPPDSASDHIGGVHFMHQVEFGLPEFVLYRYDDHDIAPSLDEDQGDISQRSTCCWLHLFQNGQAVSVVENKFKQVVIVFRIGGRAHSIFFKGYIEEYGILVF